jgi:hypothetical protein
MNFIRNQYLETFSETNHSQEQGCHFMSHYHVSACDVVLFNCMNSHRQSNKEKKGESSKRILKKEKKKKEMAPISWSSILHSFLTIFTIDLPNSFHW